MNEYEKLNLLVSISKMYYHHNYSQQEIASKLKLSRTYIGKLLNEAREKGIVEIKINDPIKSESGLEENFRKRFGLIKAIIIPTEDSDPLLLEKLGSAAAEYFNLILQDNDVVGVAWGETLYMFSKKVNSRSDLVGIQVVQVCGGVTKINDKIYASDIPKNISRHLNCPHYVIPLPAVLESITAKNTLMKDKNITHVMSLARKSTIVLFSVGNLDETNTFIKAGYFSNEEFENLGKTGAIGDVCSHIINNNGGLYDIKLEKRTVALSLDEISTIPTRICIAAGRHKRNTLASALQTGCINVLVTNEQTANALLK